MSEIVEMNPEDRPMWRVVTALLERDPLRTGASDRHYYRCPAHADRSPSLSVAEGRDGRVLVHCFAGCSVEEVCRALGLTIRDLFVPRGPELPEGPRLGRATGVLAAYAVKYPQLAWLIEQVRDDRMFYLDRGPREQRLLAQYPEIPALVWDVLRK